MSGNATKVSHVSLAGACAAVVAWAADRFAGISLPPGMEAAVAVIATALLAALIPADLFDRVRG